MPTSGRERASSQDRHLARAAAAAFGGSAAVHQFHDRDEQHSIAVLTCTDAPQEGLLSYSTIGVHTSPNLLDGTEVRVELAGIATADDPGFPNVLATAAFQVTKEGWLAAPGVVFPDLVSEYGLSTTLEHVLWLEPFPWPDLHRVNVSAELTVHWLLAVPIAESERRVLHEQGAPALEALFEERDVAYHDLGREPLV